MGGAHLPAPLHPLILRHGQLPLHSDGVRRCPTQAPRVLNVQAEHGGRDGGEGEADAEVGDDIEGPQEAAAYPVHGKAGGAYRSPHAPPGSGQALDDWACQLTKPRKSNEALEA